MGMRTSTLEIGPKRKKMNELSYVHTLLIVCPLVFIAGFIDSIAGGGGLVSLPAWLAAGLPPHLAAGSNKFSMMLGTATSVARFGATGNIKLKSALAAAAAAIPGAWVGTKIALLLDPAVFRTMLVAVIPAVAVFVLVRGKKTFGTPASGKAASGADAQIAGADAQIALERSPGATLVLSLAIGLAVGCYDGLVGPGTGTFLIIGFSVFLQYSLTVSSGSAKVVNLASNIVSAFLFMSSGNVWYQAAIPAALCTIAGNQLGSHLAVKNGSRVIRPVLIAVLALLFAKILRDWIAF